MSNTENSGTPRAAAVFFDQVAAAILQQHVHALPDLREAVIILPNYHVAVPLAQHLARAANLPALLLPQMVTINDWAESVPLTQAITPDTCRATTLYQALREREWFPGADLWGIASELLGLLDELTKHHVPLPQSEEDFLLQLERACQAKRNAAMQFEARVVHELWYAMSASGELDAARAYQQRLALLAQRATSPLTVLLTSDLSRLEMRFLQAYGENAPVNIIDLRELAAQQAGCAVLNIAWGRDEAADDVHAAVPSLREQARRLRTHFPQAALGSSLRLFAANGLEQEARAAEVQVRCWLLAGKSSIAIVAQDRLAARRVRALLERAEVQVQDETGWILSTMAVSTVLMRWLDALQSDFYYQDMLDLLKSPYMFADQPSAERKQTVYQLEQLLRKHGAVAHLEVFLELAQHEAPELGSALARLRQAADELVRKSNTLHGWLLALERSLRILGVYEGLAADAAGEKLLQAVHTWQQELAADTTRFSRAEWRHWLALQLDALTWRDASIDSPVLITHLAATRWRKFDAVLLLGCDAAHLPSADKAAVWFNDAVRDTLGLPVRAVYRAQQRDDLLCLLALNDSVLATWQASKSGEANLLSPYLEILRGLHHLAYGDDLAEKELIKILDGAQVRNAAAALPDLARMPQPVAPPALIPRRISASGYNSLVACPYQYYARHVLHLNELDEVREGIEKRDFGDWVHAILHRFHGLYIEYNQTLASVNRARLEQSLHDISAEVFAQALQRDYWARAWLLRWQQSIPAYIDAQLKSEAEGWRYQNGEVPFELPLAQDLQMRGRIDRIDVQADASHVVRVLDYKTQPAAALRNKLKQAGEDVQLPFYAHVFEATEAAFISIEKNKVLTVEPPQDVAQLAHANIERLKLVFAQMRDGVALPANGVDAVCTYCEMRGLCRKVEWA
ncbi:MAG TPA: PD-(D/E)XK nuclease family protein [Gallionellaceae bacterium]|nr:PD-(D/E)XK nuclease family protein [Gallionellaceae bacterium]